MTEAQQPPTVEDQKISSSEPAILAAKEEIAEGKPFAILSFALGFVSIPFFVIPLIMRNNEYSLFHAKQCLILWLGGIAVAAVSVPLLAICIGAILLPIAVLCLLVLNIIGLINAINGEMKPLPVIGKWGIEWFKGIKKV